MRNLLRSLLLATVLPAAALAEGINLSWDDCGTNGAATKSWACDANAGAPFTLVASFDPPANVVEFLGVASQLDVRIGAGTTPDWWRHGAGLCRGTAGLSTNFDFTSGPFSCTDFYIGQAAGGFAYDAEYPGAGNRARLRIQLAVPFENRGAVEAGTEYYALKVNLLRSNTSTCTGCATEACVVLNSIQLFQPPEQAFDPDISITNPGGRSHVTWQNPTIANCPQGTAAKNASWGQVKSLYR
jgi:hypothetical protein